MRTHKSVYQASYSSHTFTQLRRTSGLISALVLTFFFMVTLLTIAIPNLQVKADEEEKKGFDIVKWVACTVHPVTRQLYIVNTTDVDEYELDSKSSITTGQENVESANALNWLLTYTGSDFVKVNEAVLGRPIDPEKAMQNKKAEPATPSPGATPTTPATPNSATGTFNGGSTKYNPFDRFGLAGLYWTSYKGEWKYIIVDACGDAQPIDPKTGLYYEKRLVPRATYHQVDNSRDPRSELVKRGLPAVTGLAFANVVANLIFWVAKLVVGLAIALINLSFVDLVKLWKIDLLLAGSDGNMGMFSILFDNLFLPFTVIAFVATAFYIIYWGLVKGAVRKSMVGLARSVFMFFFAFWAAANPAIFVSGPNTLVVAGQTLVVGTLNDSLAGGSGLCATTIGAKNPDIKLANGEVQEGKEQDFLAAASTNMRSSVACTLWQQLLLRPWAQGQYGTGWEKMWAKGKIPSWAPQNNSSNTAYNHAALNNGDENALMVGTADVPLGAGSVVNNWAIFQLSTQTNVHAPYGKKNELPKVTNGIANDWWRIADVLSNYEEEEKDPNTGARKAGGPFSPDQQKQEADPTNTTPAPTPPPSSPGSRVNPLKKMEMVPTYPGHSGIDYRASEGTPLFAADAGTVIRAGGESTKTAYGVAVYIKNAAGETLVYGHMTAGSPTVKEGDTVTPGQQIGLSGNTHGVTRKNSGPHLHFEVVPSGGKTGVPSNRQYSLDWLNGATSDGQSESASSPVQQNTKYFDSKGNKVLPQWDSWIGSGSGGRIAVAFSALFVAIIGVAAPLVFAFFCAIYALTLALLMAFSPLMLLFACWADRGWEIFKGWAELVLNTMLWRIISALLLVFAILVNDAAIHFMETTSWWQGVVLLALMAYILITSRKRILDTVASIHFASVSFTQSYQKITRGMNKGIKTTGRVAATAPVGGIEAVRNGGSFKAGALAATKQGVRNASYRNPWLRAVVHGYDQADVGARGKNADSFADVKECYRCGENLQDADIVYRAPDGGYVCETCAERSQDVDELTPMLMDWKTTEKQEEEEGKARQGGAARQVASVTKNKTVAQQLETLKKFSSSTEGERTAHKDAFAKTIYEFTERDVRAHQALPNAEDVEMDVPDQLRPYLDPSLMATAWKERDYEFVRKSYATAWARWGVDNLESHFANAVKEIITQVELAQQGTIDLGDPALADLEDDQSGDQGNNRQGSPQPQPSGIPNPDRGNPSGPNPNNGNPNPHRNRQ